MAFVHGHQGSAIGSFADAPHTVTLDPMNDPITTSFTPLIGLPCWRVERGQDSILSFQFGAPSLLVREPYASTSSSINVRRIAARRIVKPVGEWHLFVFCCHWRVTASGEPVADDESAHDQIEAAARVLDGQKLVAVTLNADSRATTFSFDLGSVLSTWPYEADQEEQWSLYLPDQRVLTYRADGCYSLGLSDEGPDQEVWHAGARSVRVP
jgi:hypothetical protein